MTPERSLPPWEYLRLASDPSLQNYELTRLNHAANLRKEIAVLVDAWVENNAYALLARWLLENPGQLRPPDLLEQTPDPQGDLFAGASLPIRARVAPRSEAAD
jgi:hypothetical protein